MSLDFVGCLRPIYGLIDKNDVIFEAAKETFDEEQVNKILCIGIQKYSSTCQAAFRKLENFRNRIIEKLNKKRRKICK